MKTSSLALTVTLCLFIFGVSARQTEEVIDLPNCQLKVRTIHAEAKGPRFIMMEGVPLSGAVFERLANQLADRLDATSSLIDFPGVAGSHLKEATYDWGPLRACLKSYLDTQASHVFVLGDLAMPVIAPLLRETLGIQGLVSFNSVIKPSEVSPPFPINFLRCCPHLAVAVSAIMPAALFKSRLRTVGLDRQASVLPEEMDLRYAEMVANQGMSRLARLMSGISMDPAADQSVIEGLATPIPQLYLWGEADPALGQEYLRLLPLKDNQKLFRFPTARHFLMLDYASESADAIAAWHNTLHPASASPH